MKRDDFQFPLSPRVWLTKKQTMVELRNYCIESQYEVSVGCCGTQTYLSFRDDEDRNHCHYVDVRIGRLHTVDAILLRPTNVDGKKVCRICHGRRQHGTDVVRNLDGTETRTPVPCCTCSSTGEAKSPIYEGDIIEIDTARDLTHRIAIVFWHRASWHIRKSDGWWVPLWRLIEQKRQICVIGNIFEPDKIEWPESVTPKQKAWVEQEAKELKESLA